MKNVQKNVYYLMDQKNALDPINFNVKFISIGLQESNIEYEYPPHRQDEFEFIYILEGKLKYFCDGQEFVVNSGDFYFISPGQVHEEYSLAEPLKFYYLKFDLINFKGEVINRLTSQINQQIIHNVTNNFKLLMEKIYIESANKFFGHLQIVNQAITEILILLERYLGPEIRRFAVQKPIDYLIHSIKEDLTNNVTSSYSLDELASKYSVNKYYLIRAFKKNTGFTINEFMTENKMKEALKLLLNTNHSIKSISFILGYSSPFYFSKVFKEYYGESPSDYRREHFKKHVKEKAKPIEQSLKPILLSKSKINYVDFPTSIESLLDTYRKTTLVKPSINKLNFDGDKTYNAITSFSFRNINYVLANIKDRDDNFVLQLYSKKSGFNFQKFQKLNISNVTNPHISQINSDFIFIGIKRSDDVIENKKVVVYSGDSLSDLKYKVTLPKFVKGLRMIEYGGVVHAFFTVNRFTYDFGNISYKQYSRLDDFYNDNFKNLTNFSNHFINGEYGGINDLIVLKNGMIGVIGHIGKYDIYSQKQTYPAAFSFNTDTKESSKVKILLEEHFITKSDDASINRLHTCGIIRRANNHCELFVELDNNIFSVILDDPFVEYEYLQYKL